MRHRHFESLQPLCPSCGTVDGDPRHPLRIAKIDRGDDGVVLEGMLHCSNQACLHEYPIIDGIPYILPSLRSFMADNLFSIHARNDLSPSSESILGDCCGPGSDFDRMRQLLSTYVWDHYGDLDPEPTDGEPRPGATLRLLRQLTTMATGSSNGKLSHGPILEVGCGVGRGTFALAEPTDDLVLGVDLNVSMLRLAAEVSQSGKVRYPLRRVGIVYSRREYPVAFENHENVDFWACDASALPFSPETFQTAVGMNVLDSIQDPRGMLRSLAKSLRSGGKALLACPYDWTAGSTPIESWIGGHSQRGPDHGSSRQTLRHLLTPGSEASENLGLELAAESDGIDWHVRMHERSSVRYSVHLVVATANAGA